MTRVAATTKTMPMITFALLTLIHHGGGNRYFWDTYQNTAPLAIGGKLKVTES
jgi:hypothetical protein